jgi:hypothetical protein
MCAVRPLTSTYSIAQAGAEVNTNSPALTRVNRFPAVLIEMAPYLCQQRHWVIIETCCRPRRGGRVHWRAEVRRVVHCDLEFGTKTENSPGEVQV